MDQRGIGQIPDAKQRQGTCVRPHRLEWKTRERLDRKLLSEDFQRIKQHATKLTKRTFGLGDGSPYAIQPHCALHQVYL